MIVDLPDPVGPTMPTVSPGHSERVALMVVLIDLYRITSQVSICSFDRHLCQKVAVNWNLAGTGRQGQLWALESAFKIQKSIFKVGFIKNDLILPKNSPILRSDYY